MKGTIFIIAFLAVASTMLQAQEDVPTDFATGLLVDEAAFKVALT